MKFTFLQIGSILSILSLGATAWNVGGDDYYDSRDLSPEYNGYTARNTRILEALEARQEQELADLILRHEYEFELLSSRSLPPQRDGFLKVPGWDKSLPDISKINGRMPPVAPPSPPPSPPPSRKKSL